MKGRQRTTLKIEVQQIQFRNQSIYFKKILYWNKIASQLLANFKSKDGDFLKEIKKKLMEILWTAFYGKSDYVIIDTS